MANFVNVVPFVTILLVFIFIVSPLSFSDTWSKDIVDFSLLIVVIENKDSMSNIMQN